MMAEIGQRLKWVREALELSQTQIADICGVDQTTWSAYELGNRLPDHFRIPQLCGKLRISVSYLLSGDLDGVEPRLAIALAAHHPSLAKTSYTAQRTGTDPR